MKFLDTKEIEKEKGDIKAIFKPVTTLHQGTLIGYQVELNNAIQANDVGLNIQVQMKTAAYALNEMISSLIVGGEVLDPKQVADCADISDPDTFTVLKDVYEMTSGLLLDGYTKKKSSSPASPTKKTSAVKGVRKATKD